MQAFFARIVSWLKKLIAIISGKEVVETVERDSVLNPDEVVCYYGCPNSNKAKKLQLGKRSVK